MLPSQCWERAHLIGSLLQFHKTPLEVGSCPVCCSLYSSLQTDVIPFLSLPPAMITSLRNSCGSLHTEGKWNFRETPWNGTPSGTPLPAKRSRKTRRWLGITNESPTICYDSVWSLPEAKDLSRYLPGS